MTNIEKLSKEISDLTILEAAGLVKCLEKKWGIKANLASAPQVNTASNTIQENNQKKFNVVLKSSGQKKIQVIKIIREITSLGLKESKQLVDQAPKEIKSDINEEEAYNIKEKLEKIGASVELK
jgi:large subunit ribosomal protein L7/L12